MKKVIILSISVGITYFLFSIGLDMLCGWIDTVINNLIINIKQSILFAIISFVIFSLIHYFNPKLMKWILKYYKMDDN